MIKLGKIVTVRGKHGEVKVLPYTNIENIFSKIKIIFADNEEFKIKGVKYIKGCAALKLDGIDTPEDAQLLVGREIFVNEADLPVLETDSYYVKDIVGMNALDTQNNLIGTVTNVFFTGANDVYEITDKNGRTALIPAVKEFVKSVDVRTRNITLDLIDGMLPGQQ